MSPWTLYFATCPPPNAYFYLSSHSFWEQSSIKKSCFCWSGFWKPFSIIFQKWSPKVTILGPLRNPARPHMASNISQVAPNSCKKTSGGPYCCGFWNHLFPESIQIDFGMDFGRLLIDLGSILMDCWSNCCNLLSNCWWICYCFGTPFLERCLQMFFLNLQTKNKVLTRSAKIC